MFWRIFAFVIPVSMAIAILLSLNGVTYIDTGKEMYAFISALSRNFDRFKDYQIPIFTKIQQTGTGWLDALIVFANVFISIGNFFVLLINALITIFEFLIAFVTTTGEFIQLLVETYAPTIP